MSHVVKDTSRCVIDIDTVQGQVLYSARWLYIWITGPGVAPWTLAEKRRFHNMADRCVWDVWSNRIVLNVHGTSDFAKRFRTKGVAINYDIEWTQKNEHWTVTVRKIPRTTFYRSGTSWESRTIDLDSNDVYTDSNLGGGKVYKQFGVVHEFGHMAGNTLHLGPKPFGRGHEYEAGHQFENDYSSVMNIGHQLRARHLLTSLDDLNTMITGTSFSVRSIRQ